LYSHPLLTERIAVQGGYAQAPDAPGLGVTVDEGALTQYRVAQADLTLPKRLVKYSRACGVNVYFANNSHSASPMWRYFALGNQPLYERGVQTELLDDNGSAEFSELHERAQAGPVLTTG
jgi:hypothetical protein